ncbi:MAG: hypothetical protein IT210_01065 [Armatimonadetes bacterium]|nr:hypothetical protein [Armatimonadota bacterium]
MITRHSHDRPEEPPRGNEGGEPTAAQWREWRVTLQERLERYRKDRQEATPDELPEIDERVAALREQVAALRQEEWIAGFLEEAARLLFSRYHLEEEDADLGEGYRLDGFERPFGFDEEPQ